MRVDSRSPMQDSLKCDGEGRGEQSYDEGRFEHSYDDRRTKSLA